MSVSVSVKSVHVCVCAYALVCAIVHADDVLCVWMAGLCCCEKARECEKWCVCDHQWPYYDQFASYYSYYCYRCVNLHGLCGCYRAYYVLLRSEPLYETKLHIHIYAHVHTHTHTHTNTNTNTHKGINNSRV